MPDRDTIGEGRLTEDQRGIVLTRGEIFGMPYHASLMRPLIRRGLFRRVERKGFQVRWELTDTGEAMRKRLCPTPSPCREDTDAID